MSDEQDIADVKAALGTEPVPSADAAAAAAEPAADGAPAAPVASPPTALFTRAVREREKATQALAKVKAERAAFERERAEVEAERAAIRAERAKYERIQASPMAYFDEFKVDKHDFARHMMALHTPEAQAVDEVRREVAEERKAREAFAAKLEAERAQTLSLETGHLVSQAKSGFAAFVDAGDYPELAGEDPAELGETMWRLAQQHHASTGQSPTYEMVAAHMERAAAEKRAIKESRRAQRSANLQPSPSQPTNRGQPTTSPGPRTITNDAASRRSSMSSDEEDLDAWSRRQIREAFRKDANG